MEKAKKEFNVKEMAKNNIFIANARAIKHLAVAHGVDVGVALAMFCTEKNFSLDQLHGKQREFLDLCRAITLNKVVEELG